MRPWCVEHDCGRSPEYPDDTQFCLWSKYAAVLGRGARECRWAEVDVVVKVASGEIEGQVMMDA